MLQVMPKWQVDVTLSNGVRRSVWISDTFIANVLRQVATMSFDANPLVSVDGVSVSLMGSHQAAAAVDPSARSTGTPTTRVSNSSSVIPPTTAQEQP